MKILLLFLSLSALCLAQPKIVTEGDEASKDPSFLAYRQNLLAAVKRHDLPALSAALDPKIYYSYGIQKPGRDGFFAAWKVKKGDPSLWREMEEVLIHGGAFGQNGDFVAPYIFAKWPEKYDSLDYVAVLSPKASVYTKPDAQSPVVAEVGSTMLKLSRLNEKEHVGWTEVEVTPKKTGYIRNKDVRGGMDFRAIFEKKNGKWRMVTFIGGD